MGVIKRADLESYTRNAVPMDLGDLHARGEALVRAARDEANAILQRAQEERERLIEGAREEGHAEGFGQGEAEGREAGHAEGIELALREHAQRLEQIGGSWAAALDGFEQERAEMMLEAKREIVELAAHIAARVIKRSVELDPEVVTDQLDSVLETLVTPTKLRIRVSPEDQALLERVMGPMIERCAMCEHATIVEDPALAPGSVVASTGEGGEIDASISTQLDRIVAALMPAHRGPDYDELVDADDEDQDSSGESAA